MNYNRITDKGPGTDQLKEKRISNKTPGKMIPSEGKDKNEGSFKDRVYPDDDYKHTDPDDDYYYEGFSERNKEKSPENVKKTALADKKQKSLIPIFKKFLNKKEENTAVKKGVKRKKRYLSWRAIVLIEFCLLLCVFFTFAYIQTEKNKQGGLGYSRKLRTSISDIEALSLWNESSDSITELANYVSVVTNKNDPDYIPPEDRIAVFDLDGTLCCETDPMAFDFMLFMKRVLNDPNHNSTKQELWAAKKISNYLESNKVTSGMYEDFHKSFASAFSGMTVKDFDLYVKSYKKTNSLGYDGMTKGEAFYKPMIQLIDYLTDNDFIIYVVSVADRAVVRSYIDGSINVPLNHIIGSDRSIAATGQKETSGNDYIFKKDDKLINGDEHIFTDVNLNKVVSIQREIGKQPVLCFGNSSIDYSMATYTTLDNPYMSLAFIVCCDDTKREKGNVKTSKEVYKDCEENGWTPISMKNDWKTIYGEDVEKKKEASIEFTSHELDEKLHLNR